MVEKMEDYRQMLTEAYKELLHFRSWRRKEDAEGVTYPSNAVADVYHGSQMHAAQDLEQAINSQNFVIHWNEWVEHKELHGFTLTEIAKRDSRDDSRPMPRVGEKMKYPDWQDALQDFCKVSVFPEVSTPIC